MDQTIIRRVNLNTVAENISKIRLLMKKKGIDAYLIPTSDPHQSEYLPEHWKIRQWLSGFTGSAGSLAVTEEDVGLWTDGRYFIQAEREISGTEIKLFKLGESGVPDIMQWISEKFSKGATVALDGMLYSKKQIKNMNCIFPKEIILKTDVDLITPVWTERPLMPREKVFIHKTEYSGENRESKIKRVRKIMSESESEIYLISSLDDVAWLYNIRGRDIDYNPVVVSYGVVTKESALLFVDLKKLDEETLKDLKRSKVEVLSYECFPNYVKALSDKNIVLDSNKTSSYIYESIDKNNRITDREDIVARLKALKNKTEIENYRICQIRDGVAMAKSLLFIETHPKTSSFTELLVSNKVNGYRADSKEYIEPSFEMIAAFKDHSAVVHYSPNPETEYALDTDGLLLLDSGGQYLDGTTDITRTVCIGKSTREQRLDYTRVLKGHIAMATAVFPYGTTGFQLDCLARMSLWKEGKDYRHGTGHGVGYLLSVHEGPQRISPFPNSVVLEEGMLVTNEPGYYKEGEYGIRLENVLLVKTHSTTEYGKFMSFETLTLCPFEIDMIEIELLNREEKYWINKYHEEVYREISPYLEETEREWLECKTQKIQ